MNHLPFVASLVLAYLPAQEAFHPRRFLPSDYRNIVHVDLQQLRDTGVWDELAIGAVNAALGMAEEQMGFPLEHLDRFTLVPGYYQAYEGARRQVNFTDDDDQKQLGTVRILEGNCDLGVPEALRTAAQVTPHEQAEYQVLPTGGGDEIFFRPRDEVQVFGNLKLLEPVLAGRPGTGPCADIMSLLSTSSGKPSENKSTMLAYVVFDLSDKVMNGGVVDLKKVAGGADWPEGGDPQFAMLRALATGDPDDPHMELELVIRHGKAGDGVLMTDKLVANFIEESRKNGQLRMFAPMLKTIDRQRDGIDLSIRCDLGRARTSGGPLSTVLMTFMTFGSSTHSEGLVLPAGGVPEPPPPPREKAKEAKPIGPKQSKPKQPTPKQGAKKRL